MIHVELSIGAYERDFEQACGTQTVERAEDIHVLKSAEGALEHLNKISIRSKFYLLSLHQDKP